MVDLAPQTLLTPVVQYISVGAALGNTWTGRTARKTSRTGFDRSNPISTQNHTGISKTSTPASSDNDGARISIGTSGTSNAPTVVDIWGPGIDNKRQLTSPKSQ